MMTSAAQIGVTIVVGDELLELYFTHYTHYYFNAPRQLLTGWVSHSRPIGCPQMTWGRTLENALKSKGISKDLDEWIAIAKDRSKWRQLTHSIPKPPDA